MSAPVPIIDRQRRLVEVGRLRMGEKKESQSGKKYPAKRSTWRLTSRDRARLDAAALIYGGEVREWEDQWELGTTSDVLDIAVVPGQALSVTYEEWGQARPKKRGDKEPNPVICLRRCDGVTEMLSGASCPCAFQEDQTCLPTTRLSVVLRKVPGLGVWRVDSKGWNSFYEIAGSIELLESLVASRRPVSARLRLDQRTTTTATGTRNFVVPVVDIDHTMDDILNALGAGTPVGLPAAADAAAPSFSPVPVNELAPGPQPSVRDQAMAAPVAKARRANAAEPIPATGMRPRPAVEVVSSVGSGSAPVPGAGTQVVSGGDEQDAVGAPSSRSTSGTVEGASEATDGTGDTLPLDDWPTLPLKQSVAIWCREAGIVSDDARHEFLLAFSNGRYSSSGGVDAGDVTRLRSVLGRVAAGGVKVVVDSDVGDVPRLVSVKGGAQPGGSSANDITAPTLPDWKKLTDGIPGVGPGAVLRRARSLAGEMGVEQPSAVEEIPESMFADLTVWLDESREASADA